MLEYISIFRSLILLFIVTCLMLVSPMTARAEGQAQGADNTKGAKTLQPEEDDFSNTPFTEYGEFNEDADENEETKFFQYGRFVGISLGTGIEGATGNRGGLWQEGLPMIDFRLHYWFDFHFAMDVGFFTVPHFYEISNSTVTSHTDVNMTFVGLAVKYYADTKNLSAPISFANPYLLMGGGVYYKTEVSASTGDSDPDSTFSINAGAGLEFPIKPRKVYLAFEGRLANGTFKDTFIATSGGPDDRTGYFYTFTTSFLFTW